MLAMETFQFQSVIKARPEDVYNWHTRDGAFERLQPPWVKSEILTRRGGLEVGARTDLKIKLGPFSKLWIAEHDRHEAGKSFRDVQRQGPFRSWKHEHSFRASAEDECVLDDRIQFELPGGFLGQKLGIGYARRQLEKLFAYRHAITRADCETYRRFADQPRKRICIAGGSGFTGRQLANFLRAQGHEVFVLSRHPKEEHDVGWDTMLKRMELEKLSNVEVVIQLSGAGLADRRWTKRRKELLRTSRIDSTGFLVDSLKESGAKLDAFICASGSGFYGDSSQENFTEDSPMGKGFLAELCHEWEDSAQVAHDFSRRVAYLRMGVVIDPRGGALAKMLPAFRFGLGGRLGDGRQWMPWIALEDWIRVANEVIYNETLDGPINVCSPEQITNADFTNALGNTLSRPTILPVPQAMLKLIFGEMAEETLLASCRMRPAKLLESKFSFLYPEIQDSLRLGLGT